MALRTSIALCTRNGERFLREQLASIAGQTRRPDELVVCDDASTDGTLSIVEAFAASAGFPVRVHRNDAALGVTKNFEKAASLCGGDVIFFADQDDVWLPGKVAVMAGVFEGRQDAAAAFCDATVVDAADRPLGYGLWESVWFTEAERRRFEAGDALRPLLKHAIAAGTTLAFRARCRDVLLPYPDLRHCHDMWTVLVLACLAEAAVVPVPERLVRYRLHGANQVGMKNWNLWEQVAKAREQLQVGAFRYAAELHQAAIDRLASPAARHHAVRPEALRLLGEKVEHSRLRDAMRGGFLSRLPGVWREVRNGGYWRYGYGYKSVLQDLFLR